MNRRTFLIAAAFVAAGGRAAFAEASITDIVLTEIERRLIGAYYQSHYDRYEQEGGNHKHKGLPPGLAKRGTLPPGLEKQLVRNGTLPPGLAWRPLPDDLMVQLPHRPADQRIVIVDDKVMLIRVATNLILDLLTVAAVDAAND
jgi:hypothetical protein